MNNTDNIEFDLYNDIKNAINLNEFKFVYQPKFNIKTKSIIGAEVLVRWDKKDGSTTYPDEFISKLEDKKLIYLLDYHVIEESIKKISEWNFNFNIDIVPISINLSKSTLMRDDFIGKLNELIEKYKLDLNCLEFEITERESFDYSIIEINNRIEEIKSLGIKISIDDFGAGNSNISFSMNIDLDIIKIDKSIIAEIGKNKKIDYILVFIRDLAKLSNIDLIAEGIETKEQCEFLVENGYDFGQGYYLSRPIEIDEFEVKYLGIYKCI